MFVAPTDAELTCDRNLNIWSQAISAFDPLSIVFLVTTAEYTVAMQVTATVRIMAPVKTSRYEDNGQSNNIAIHTLIVLEYKGQTSYQMDAQA